MNKDIIRLFSNYMKLTGTPSLKPASGADPKLSGKKLGVVNAASWISLWSTYFGQRALPGVKIINSGNEAVQLNFMKAYQEQRPCPPQQNIDLFCQYAEELHRLYEVDAILISCSTMNRSYQQVSTHMDQFNIPVIQIDVPLMESAVNIGGNLLVIATHGPTVKSTQALLKETSNRFSREVQFTGATVEQAFELLGQGEIEAHNEVIAEAIRTNLENQHINAVVLAQLSMSVFALSYPNPEIDFGVPVLNSAELGFARVAEVLRSRH